jgi:hypothetical protein
MRSSGAASLAVISGTLDIALDTLFPDHPFDDVFCNRIRFGDDGAISGWQATLDMEVKADALRLIAERESAARPLRLRRGSVSDLAAARAAGLAIAFNPKSPELEAAAQAAARAGSAGDPAPVAARARGSRSAAYHDVPTCNRTRLDGTPARKGTLMSIANTEYEQIVERSSA